MKNYSNDRLYFHLRGVNVMVHEIISVILNTSENSITASAKESRKLLEWGFNNWTW